MIKKNHQSYSYLLEVVLAVGIMVAVNIVWWPDKPAFTGINPHPYWLVVLPMAVYYGFREGVFAATVCAILYVTWTWYLALDKYWLVFLTFERLAVPVGFLAGGMILGELRERHRRKEKDQAEKILELEEALQDLSVRHVSLAEANRELELRILSQDQTVQTLYQAAEGLKDLDEESVFPAILDILVDYLGVMAASIYLLEDDKFILKTSKGEIEETLIPPEISSREGLMGGALTNRSLATVRMILSTTEVEDFERYPILIAAPLVLEGGAVIGMVNVHKLPFLRFTPATVRMVGLLADWAGIALANARRHKEVADKNISDELTGAYTPEYLHKRFKEEFSRARRYGMTLAIIMAKVEDYDDIEDVLKRDVLAVLGNIFAGAIRDSDMLFRYRGEDTFVLLLPATPVDGCRVVMERMVNELRAFQFKPYTDQSKFLELLVGASEYTVGMTEYTEMLDKAELDMEQ